MATCVTKTGTIDLSTGNPAASLCGVTSWYQKESGVAWLVFPTGQHRVRIRIAATAPVTLQYDFYQRPTPNEHCYTWLAGTTFDATLDAPTAATSFGLGFFQGGTNPSSWLHGAAVTVDFSNVPGTETPCDPPAPCLPRLKPGQDVQVFVTDSLLALITAPITGAAYVLQLMRFSIGQVITIENLCTLAPPVVPPLDGSMWGSPFTMAYWGGVYLEALAWWYFCECTTGTGPALPPPPPIVDHPDRPDDPTYTPNPTNPCLDLTEVRRKLDQLLAITKSDLDADTLMQRYGLPFATIPGAVHSGLTGSGSFAISRLVGVRIEWTAGAAAAEWEGQPRYYKDLGWVSANDGGGMLLERRVTRTAEEWLPSHFNLATSFGYYAKPGITLKVTELQAEP